MRVYLAAPFVEKDAMPAVAARIEAAGHVITEPWWLRNEADYPDYPSNRENEELTDIAVDDFMGVATADAIIVINSMKSEGKAVETGIALAYEKPVMLVGTRSNIFHYMPNVYTVASVEEALERLK